MNLMTNEVREALPKLQATENESDPTANVKLFTPWSDWTWYGVEFDGEDTLFGLVVGFESELGYFSLRELEGLRGRGGLRIERDLFVEPNRFSVHRMGDS